MHGKQTRIHYTTSLLALHGTGLIASAGPLPVTSYLGFGDSPFSGTPFADFHLEDMEDGLLNTLGLSVVSNTPGTTIGAIGMNPNADSVDEDDGVIDGLGRDGMSLAEVNNISTENLGYTFSFDPVSLGYLPTHVGLVWTDGGFGRSTIVEFFDADGELLGSIGPTPVGDNSFAGGTAEDRFFGAIFEEGVASMTIRTPGGVNVLEVDHIQYGIVPTPATLAAIVASGLLVPRRGRRG